MYRIKLTFSPQYRWSWVVYIRGTYACSGDFYHDLSDVRARINDVLSYNAL